MDGSAPMLAVRRFGDCGTGPWSVACMAASLVVAVGGATTTAGAQSEPAAGGWTWGPGAQIRNAGGRARLRLTAYGQLDFASFRNWEDRSAVDPLRDDHFDVGRLRAGLEGEWGRLSFEAEGDVRDDRDALKDLWLGLRVCEALRLRVGHQKTPVGGEWLISARRIDFVQRSLPASSLAPGRDWGLLLHGEIARRLQYEAGLFAGDGRRSADRAETTGAARLLVEPVRGLRLGGSFSIAHVAAVPAVAGDAGDPRGLQGEAHSGFEYFARKFVDGRRRRLGGEATFTRGPVRVSAEYLEAWDERRGQGSDLSDLPAVRGRGFSTAATWLLTGEAKKRAVKPKHPLAHGPGAWELGVRYDALRFDDEGPDSGFSGVGDRSRNLVPLADRALTGGLSWWPVAEVRLLANVVVERFDDARFTPEPGRRGRYVTLQARLQLELP